ncbi:MAG: hypothetical protein HC917_00095 [Richelia sp. SM2_1_7]|nr:hypothetical protein [Richelia sp. SM2_1_7]
MFKSRDAKTHWLCCMNEKKDTFSSKEVVINFRLCNHPAYPSGWHCTEMAVKTCCPALTHA